MKSAFVLCMCLMSVTHGQDEYVKIPEAMSIDDLKNHVRLTFLRF